MPKEITHMLLAEKTARTIRKKAEKIPQLKEYAEILRKNLKVMRFGSFSPDIMFYDIPFRTDNKKLPRGLRWAQAVHGVFGEDNMRGLPGFIDYIRSIKPGARKNKIIAFFSGYLTHAALDITMHPLVYYFSGNYYADSKEARKQAETRHRVIETILDLYLLDKLKLKRTRYNVIKKARLKKRERKHILLAYTRWLGFCFGHDQYPDAAFEVAEKQSRSIRKKMRVHHKKMFLTLKRSYTKTMIFNRVIASKFVAARLFKKNQLTKDGISEISALFYPEVDYGSYLNRENPLIFDVLPAAMHPVTGRPLQTIENSLMCEAIARARHYCSAFYLACEGRLSIDKLRKVLPGRSFNSGLPGYAVSDMQYFKPMQLNGNFEFTGY